MSDSSNEKPVRSALDWTAATGTGGALMQELERRARRRRRGFVATSGLVAACMLGVAAWSARVTPEPTATTAAVVLRPMLRSLPDGSTAEMREHARISVHYSDRVRRVYLLEGEVHFAVLSDPSRPFVVSAPGIDVRAVGTAFSVHRDATGVEVLVTKGRVAVNRPAVSATEPLALLTAGDIVRVREDAQAPAPEVISLPTEVVAERMAWRVPRLEFSGTALREVVQLFNGHSQVQLRLEDSALEHLRVSGIVRADNVGALVRLLVANYPVTAEQRGEFEIVLRRP